MVAKILLQELSAPGCLHCKEFKEFWESIKSQWPDVEFQEVSVVTGEGQELAQKHMIFASPAIVINGTLFSTGGVDKKKFVEKLKELTG